MAKHQKLDIRISSDLKKEIEAEAQRQDRSKAWIVIAAIRQYLSRGEPK